MAFVQTYGGDKFSVSDGRFAITRFLLLVDVDILSISLHVVAFIYVGWLTPRSDVPRKLSHAAIISPRFVRLFEAGTCLSSPALSFLCSRPLFYEGKLDLVCHWINTVHQHLHSVTDGVRLARPAPDDLPRVLAEGIVIAFE